MKMSRILVVDDEDSFRMVVKMLLEKEEHEIFEASSGEDALKKIREVKPDLLLLDVMMPGMSGMDVLKAVRKKHPESDVIMVTAYGNIERAVEALRLGAYDFIQKPMDNEEFMASIRRCLERRRLDEEINRLKELNERIVKQMNEGIIIQDAEGTMTFTNPKAEEMLGYQEGQLVGVHWSKLVAPGDMEKVEEGMKEWRKGKEGKYECTLLGKDGKEIPVLNTVSPLMDNGIYAGLLCAFIDISERKKAEDEMKRKMLKYRLENGDIYLVKAKELDKAVEVFADLLGIGYEGIVITRSHPREMKAKVKDETPVIWITEEEFPGSALPPQLYLIEKEIRDFVARDKVVLLDRLDYLIAKLGFEEVLKLVQKLNELFYIRKGVLILSVDPSTLTPQQLSLLEKETREAELRIKPGISEELYDILEYVHEENRVGKKPYHRDVAEKFNITKVTTVKRLKALKAMGLLLDRRKGRYKALELTEQGRAFF
jgi:PAS domain S-box-containing protein